MDYKVLIVEDEKEISRILAEFLIKNGYNVIQAYDGITAAEFMKNQSFDIVLLDLMLPEKSGEQIIGEFRQYSNTPVIVISAKSMLETRIEVLRIGADDYILKPFDLKEVLVRIQVVLRRIGKNQTVKENIFEYCGLKLYADENRAEFNGNAVNLTAKELMLLRLFMEYPKKVFTKANLYESVWNEEYIYEDNTINVHLSNLRSKLKKMSGMEFIDTVWGIGYKLKEINK